MCSRGQKMLNMVLDQQLVVPESAQMTRDTNTTVSLRFSRNEGLCNVKVLACVPLEVSLPQSNNIITVNEPAQVAINNDSSEQDQTIFDNIDDLGILDDVSYGLDRDDTNTIYTKKGNTENDNQDFEKTEPQRLTKMEESCIIEILTCVPLETSPVTNNIIIVNEIPQSVQGAENNNGSKQDDTVLENNDDPDDPDYVPDINVDQNEGNTASNNNDVEDIITDQGLDDYSTELISSTSGVVRKKRNKKPIPDTWEKNIAKNARMKGEKFVGYQRDRNGKVMRVPERKERTMGPKCVSEKCNTISNRHCNKFTEPDRQTLFNYFWKDLNWKEKKVYVSSLVDKMSAKKSSVKPGSSSRRSNSYVYSLKLKDEKKVVCKKTFLNTFGLKEWMVHNWVKKHSYRKTDSNLNNNDSSNDDETQDKKLKKKRTRIKQVGCEKEENNTYLKNFFRDMPKLPSHYCRQRTSKLYLEPLFSSKKQLYDLYVSKCTEDKLTPVCQTKFYTHFKNSNLALFQPRKDRCDTCCAYETKNISEEVWQEHVAKKQRARIEKEKDKDNPLKGNWQAGAFYYKTKLCSHNFTIYNVATHQCTNYWWNETQADLTASTFASCLVDYLKKHCLERKLPVVIYSDGCTYQNRNVTMSNALLHLATQNDIKIEQKFLTKRHTTMECDSVHACIERRLKNKDIFLPADYVTATKEARKKPFPYDVKYLTYGFFKDYTLNELQYYDSIRPGKKSGDPVVTDIVCLNYTSNVIAYKINYNDDYQDLPRRPSKVRIEAEAPALYSSQLVIPLSKWNHLQELKNVIPVDFHSFYDNLPHLSLNTQNQKRQKKN